MKGFKLFDATMKITFHLIRILYISANTYAN
jgi:hypothetical protein